MNHQSIEVILAILICVELMIDAFEIFPSIELGNSFLLVGHNLYILFLYSLQISSTDLKTFTGNINILLLGIHPCLFEVDLHQNVVFACFGTIQSSSVALTGQLSGNVLSLIFILQKFLATWAI